MLPPTLVGDVVERTNNSKAPKTPATAPGSSTGFPTAKHRSQSAFARARHARSTSSDAFNDARVTEIPRVVSVKERQDAPSLAETKPEPAPEATSTAMSPSAARDAIWRNVMERENTEMVSQMTEDEMKMHASEIIDQLGPNMCELIRKVKKTREMRQANALQKALDEPEGGFCLFTGMTDHGFLIAFLPVVVLSNTLSAGRC